MSALCFLADIFFMIRFEVTGSVDPILKAHLESGDTLYCESNAMVAMDEALSLSGTTRGGVFKALTRNFLTDESFFQQRISAEKNAGDVLLSPALAGDVRILRVGDASYTVADSSYLASTEGVILETKTQGIAKALFANTGSGMKGFFILQASGDGELAVSGFGSIREIEVTPEKSVIVNNGHVVAWDSALTCEPVLNTAHKGFFGKIVHSVVTGAGIVLKFSGSGRVLVSSRNRMSFLSLILGQLPHSKKT